MGLRHLIGLAIEAQGERVAGQRFALAPPFVGRNGRIGLERERQCAPRVAGAVHRAHLLEQKPRIHTQRARQARDHGVRARWRGHHRDARLRKLARFAVDIADDTLGVAQAPRPQQAIDACGRGRPAQELAVGGLDFLLAGEREVAFDPALLDERLARAFVPLGAQRLTQAHHAFARQRRARAEESQDLVGRHAGGSAFSALRRILCAVRPSWMVGEELGGFAERRLGRVIGEIEPGDERACERVLGAQRECVDVVPAPAIGGVGGACNESLGLARRSGGLGRDGVETHGEEG